VAAALAPFAWQCFTDEMLARRVIGAADQHVVVSLVSSVPGAEVGVLEPVEPAEPGDERIGVLLRALEGRLWRGLSLDRLCVDLVDSLAAWQAERESRRLFDDS
jgi:hypothetical protein